MKKEVVVRLQDVHKTYRLGEVEIKALRGVNLDIYRGEFTALIGSSGSGKTTVLNLIGGLDAPSNGRVLIEDQEIQNLDEKRASRLRNQKIGFVFQSFNLIPVLSVFENVELPLQVQSWIAASERRERVVAALEEVGMKDFLHQSPNRLSGGQRQRVAIARALVTKPALILADEPTASLDSGTANKIIDLLLELNQQNKVTFLFCSHDDKLIHRVHRVVEIKDGLVS